MLSSFATVETNEQLKNDEMKGKQGMGPKSPRRKQPGIGTQEPVNKQPGGGTQRTLEKKSMPNRRETKSLNRSRVRVTQSWTKGQCNI